MKRLTECIDSHFLDNGEMVKEYDLNKSTELNQFSCMDIPNAVYDKLGTLEDIMEKYDIESMEEFDNLIMNCRTYPTLTEERIKEIAINEQRKVLKSMIKEITEKECNKLYEELNIWKKACELMGKTIQNVYPDPFYRFTQDIPNYFYQQAKNLEANSEKTSCNTDN